MFGVGVERQWHGRPELKVEGGEVEEISGHILRSKGLL